MSRHGGPFVVVAPFVCRLAQSGFSNFKKNCQKIEKNQVSCEGCSFSQSNDKASGEGCAPFVRRLAQSRFSFPMQELRKIGKSCFPMSVVHL